MARAPSALCAAFLLPLAALAMLACADPADVPLAPTPEGRIPEVTVDGAALARDFFAEDGFLLSPVLEAPDGATRVAMLLTLAAPVSGALEIEARGFDADGYPGDWRAVSVTHEDWNILVARAELGLSAHAAQIRMPRALAAHVELLTWSAMVPEPPRALPEGSEVGAAREALRDDLAAAGVRSRSSWGARATRCTSRDPVKSRMAIHHTVTASMGDPAAILRGIQAYHMDGNGWCDVGYHFFVTLDGTIWEARSMDLLGAHVGGHNTGNIGIVFVGCFHTSSCGSYPPNVPPDAMLAGGARIVSELARIHGIGVSASTVKGHRDHPDQSTACPGDHLEARLDAVRAGVPSAPRFGAEYVHQSFPLASDPFVLAPGEIATGTLELRNTGTETWQPGVTNLGTTEPRDGASPLYAPSWLGPNRAATIDRAVAPGETGTFAFEVRAPAAPGDYPQYFNVVQEGVAWFGDPGEGGPPDRWIQIRVTVEGTAAVPDAGGRERDAGVPGRDAEVGLPGGGPSGDGLESGCSALPGRSPESARFAFTLAVFLAVARAVAGRKHRRD